MNKKFLSLCAIALACTSVAAQDESLPKDSLDLQQLDEVIVSDSRFALKRENSGKTVIKITSEELKHFQSKSVADVINMRSGFEIAGSRGHDGNILGVFARGGRGRQTLVLIDGVRVTDPSSASQEYDLRMLSVTNIESIEIIKGAASTLYGTNAATAVINITTKKASSKKVALTIQTSRGTNHTTNDQNYDLAHAFNSVQLGGTLNKLTYQAAFSNRFSEGLSANITPNNEEDVFSKFNVDMNVGYRFSDAFSINLYGNNTKLKTDYDDSFTLTDASNKFISDQKRAGLAAQLKYKKGSITLNAAIAEYDSENISSFPFSFAGKNYSVDLFNKLNFNDNWYTVFGINAIKDEADFETTKEFTITDPYLNAVYVSPFGLNLNAGLRLNLHSEYGNTFVYNLNPSYVIKMDNNYLKFMVSYATSYITPSLTQLFGNFGANPDLQPEDNRTMEGGVEYKLGTDLKLSGLYFNRKEENFVFFDGANFQYLNATDTIDAQGFEFELNWKPSDKLQLNTNYTFTERKGDNAIRIPKHKINALLGYTISEKTFTSLSYAYTGQRFDTDFSVFSDVALDPYSLVDFYISHDLIAGKLEVFFSLQNILNEEYVELIGFTTSGRNIRAGATLRL